MEEDGFWEPNPDDEVDQCEPDDGAELAALAVAEAEFEARDSKKRPLDSASAADGGRAAGVVEAENCCFKCDAIGHFARNCSADGAGAADGAAAAAEVSAYSCPTCEQPCAVMTSHSAANPGRAFFKCGDCPNTFKWQDEAGAAAPRRASSSAAPAAGGAAFACPSCQAPCAVLTSQSAANPGRAFFKCAPCGTFKWQDEAAAGGAAQPRRAPSQGDGPAAAPGGGGGTCYKCQQAGHWARDCPGAAAPGGGGGGGGGGSGGTCYKCQQSGHWARDCPGAGGGRGGGSSSYQSGGGGRGGGGGGGSGTTCYKCNKSGHWARDCPGGGSRY